MSKHTPGPWRMGHFADEHHSCDCRYIFGNDDRMGAVAEVFVTDDSEGVMSDNPPPDEAKANMRLIAAAPDMLKGLKGIRANLIRLAWEENSLMIEGIDALIAKAEGGAK